MVTLVRYSLIIHIGNNKKKTNIYVEEEGYVVAVYMLQLN